MSCIAVVITINFNISIDQIHRTRLQRHDAALSNQTRVMVFVDDLILVTETSVRPQHLVHYTTSLFACFTVNNAKSYTIVAFGYREKVAVDVSYISNIDSMRPCFECLTKNLYSTHKLSSLSRSQPSL